MDLGSGYFLVLESSLDYYALNLSDIVAWLLTSLLSLFFSFSYRGQASMSELCLGYFSASVRRFFICHWHSFAIKAR